MMGLGIEPESKPAGYLIVGHVKDKSAVIWVKGSSLYDKATLNLSANCAEAAGQQDHCQTIDLVKNEDNIAIATFNELSPNTPYQVTALFESRRSKDTTEDASRKSFASFRTAPDQALRGAQPFSFLLGSCNLSIVSINNLASRALQIIGVYAARQSLRRPIEEDTSLKRPLEGRITKFGRWWMRSWCRRSLIDLALKLGVGAIFIGTGAKWPEQPLLRSPFLKLEALFAGQAIQFQHGIKPPLPGSEVRGSRSGASGILAFTPRLTEGQWQNETSDDQDDDSSPDSKKSEMAAGTLTLVSVEKQFETGERLFIYSKDDQGRGPIDLGTIGYVVAVADVTSDYHKPDFTIHAGDQIYFDVPNTKRPPEIERYHEAYREAWFEDRHQRAFLARGAHYMTLDDHELVNDFSLDREILEEKDLPKGYTLNDFSTEKYSNEAMKAYQHYVQQRQCRDARYFNVDYGQARFFFLDTRTERRCRPDKDLIDPDPSSRMIGKKQMKAFKDWLEEGHKKHPSSLKFVVSSVPFIAEVLPDSSDDEQARRLDRSDDKWSGAPYRRQREEIIELIDELRIENVVFLVGDMHCAYHASMTIGKGRRWERLRVHELAGGPINQLQHGRRRQFATATRYKTRKGEVPYDIRLHQFHSGANAVMHIEIADVEDEHCATMVPEIHWRVIRTLTDFDRGPCFGAQCGKPGMIEDQAPISGRITMRPSVPRHGEPLMPAHEQEKRTA